MKKLLYIFAGLLIAIAPSALAQTIPSLPQWTVDGSNNITQRTDSASIKITGLTAGDCLKLSAGNILESVVCSSASGSGTVSTSTVPTVGQLAYWTSKGYPSLLGSVATSTLLATSPLTGSFTHVGSAGSLGIQVANTSQSGYLTSTDWNTFNNKQYSFATSTLTAGSGLTGSFVQVGTGGSLSLNNTGNWAGTWQTHSPSYFQVAGNYLTSYDAFTHPSYGGSATTSLMTFGDGIITGAASSTISATNLHLGSLSNGLLYVSSTKVNSVSTSSPVSLNISGNSGTATKLATARTIGGVSFDGSANISLTSGSSLLYGNGSGGFSNATVGTGLTFSSGTLSANNNGTVTSVAATVPTGLSISGSPITTSGTLALSYATGYAAVKTASTTNWNGFYDTPSTRITAGTNLSWSGNTLNATGGGTFAWTPTTNYGATANSTSTPIWFKSGIQASTTANYFAGLTIDNGSASNAWATYGKSGHEWSEGYNATGNYFEISSSTALGTSDVFKADKSLNVFLPSLSSNGLVKTSGGTGQLSIATNGTDYTLITANTCTNQVFTAATAAGVFTCSTVSNAMLANSTISGISLGSNLNSLSVSGSITGTSYNGSASVSNWALNMANANTWTALQQFGNATSTQFSAGSSNQFYINSAGKVTGYDTIYSHTGQLNPMRPISIDLATTTTWTGTSTTASLYGDMAAIVAPWTGTFTKASCFTNAGTFTVELTSGTNHAYLKNASTTAGINTFSLSMTKGDKMYLQAGNPATSPQRVNCTFMGYITP